MAPEEQKGLEIRHVRFGEAKNQKAPGSVVDMDGVLGVAMPDIAPMQPGRVLLIGSLFEPLDPNRFEEGEKGPRQLTHLGFKLDERNFPLLPTVRSLYHQALYGMDWAPQIVMNPTS